MINFKENITNIYGEEGKQWLNSLGSNLNAVCQKYGISNLSPVDNMTFNYVASGLIEKKPIILKYGLNKKALEKEAAAIKAFSNYGGVDHIADEPNLIIMQQALPGNTLKEKFPTHDEFATKILCKLAKSLHGAPIPQSNSFYQLSRLFQVIDEFDELPQNILTKARQIKIDVFKRCNRQVLLHGDLHHDNIIRNDNRYVAIDPKGFIGDPLYDLTAYIINPKPELLGHPIPQQLIQNRIELCANELGTSAQDICNWTFLKAVKCWIWCLQDNLDDGYFKNITFLLEMLCET